MSESLQYEMEENGGGGGRFIEIVELLFEIEEYFHK